MSTIDPDAARRAEAARTPAARDVLPLAVIAFLLPVAPALLVPRMIANASEHDVFDAASALALISLLVASATTILSIIRWATLVARNPALPGIAAPLGLALLGVALGLSLTAVPPAWVAAPRPNWAVVILGMLGLGVLGLSILARRSRLRAIARDDAIMRAAAPVAGVVTNKGYDLPTTEASAVLTTVTYAFEDAAGTRRYVRKGERIPMNDPLLDGEKVDVWFDRDHPSEVKRIVVRRREAIRR